MSKYRCPVCGASHKEPVVKCRLCGQDMTSPNAVPTSTGGARIAKTEKKGVAIITVAAIVGVIVIAVAALLLGLTNDTEVVDEVKSEIPGLNETDDGWVTIEDQAGGITAELPPGNTQTVVPSPLAADGTATGWTGPIGAETDVYVWYANTERPENERAVATLERLSDLDAASSSSKVTNFTETNFAGYPAAIVEFSNVTTAEGEQVTAKAMYVLKGDRLYIIESVSAYPDHPTFDRLVSGVTFTA